MREIVFDTETTGLDLTTDRIIEIGCVELINHIPSGKTYQVYINPKRSISVDSFRVHGLSEAFLSDKPVFAETVDDFFSFIDRDTLIAHNAEFDLAFVNAELGRMSRPGLNPSRLIDSLALARRRYPAGPNSLDALCGRYGIDRSARTVHGALVDATLLAEVYVELIGGRQASLALGEIERRASSALAAHRVSDKQRPVKLPVRVHEAALAAHGAFVAELKNGGIWAAYKTAN